MTAEENVTSPDEVEQAASINASELTVDQQQALRLLEEVCAASGLECAPIVRSLQGAYIYIDLAGPDAHLTWGRMGHSLDALQFLCNLIISHRVTTDVRIVLDSDSYRQRRAHALELKALEIAREVKERQEEAEFEPLPSHERRLIHTLLADDPDISTYSEGDDPDRHVVISPKRR